MAYRYESATIIRVATILGTIGAGCVFSIAFLAWERVPVPDAIASIGGGAVGALATLLATYLPSPVPGGRRAIDAALSTTKPGEVPSIDSPASDTLSGGTTVSGKGGPND